MLIDSHQHFWRPHRNDYGWLTEDLEILYKNYEPEDLAPLLKTHKITGSILIQAAPSDAETDFLLALSDLHDSIKGVVGWVDFTHKNASHRISDLAKHPKLVGLRPMIQDIDDINWMLCPTVASALNLLSELGLVFDALVKPIHLKNLKILVDQHPNLKFVINHGAKPNIQAHQLNSWKQSIRTFKNNNNVTCKLSGLTTEAKINWQPNDLYPYMDTLFEVFGEDRILWGSDWPVSLLACTYEQWFNLCKSYLSHQPSAMNKILGSNAIRIYNLKVNT